MSRYSIRWTAVGLFVFLTVWVCAVSGQTIVGWRGNWTGKFPDANPPIKWSKVSKQMKDLRCQAEKPKDDKPSGVSVYTGSFTEWLVLGPFPVVEDKEKAAGDKKKSIVSARLRRRTQKDFDTILAQCPQILR